MNLLVYLNRTQFLPELCSDHKSGKSNLAFAVLKSNQDACTRKQTQIESATGPVKAQIFVKGFENRFQINVTINYTSYLYFIFKGIF